MKYLLLALLIAGCVCSLQITLQSSIPLPMNQKNIKIPLTYQGGSGIVKFTVKGLPKGLQIKNNAVVGYTDEKNGYYPILIDAVDSEGNQASQICVLKVGATQSTNFISSVSSSVTSSGNTGSSGSAGSIQSVTATVSSVTDIPGVNQFLGNYRPSNNIPGSSATSTNTGNSVNLNVNNAGATGGSFGTTSFPTNGNVGIISGINGGANSGNIRRNTGNTGSVSVSGNNNIGINVGINNSAINGGVNIGVNNIGTNPGSFNNNGPNFNTNPSGSSSNPSSGNPNLASPSLPTITNPSTPQDLQNLLNELVPGSGSDPQNPGFSNFPNGNPQNNFPNFPSGSNPQVPNNTPNIIRTAQAPRTSASRNQITEDDVRTTAIFERQLNANKAIANLLKIVDQLKANVNAAKSDTEILENELNNAVSYQKNTQAKIISAENKISRLKQAINNLNGKVDLLNNQLTQLQQSFQQSSNTISSKKTTIQTLQNQISQYEAKVVQLNDQITYQNNTLAEIEKQIENTLKMLQDFKFQLDKKRKELENIDQLIDDAVRNVRNIDEQITDLKNRMNAAIDRKVKAERQELKLRNIKTNAPAEIAKLEDSIRQKERQVDTLNKNKGKTLDTLNELSSTLDETSTKLEEIKSKTTQIKTEITVVNGNKSDFDQAIANKNAEINESLNTLKFLQSQLGPYEQALNAVYRQGSDANNAVRVAQQNLQAITIRWQDDENRLQNALSNLEKARAEKELADLAMEQLLKQKSDTLPYSIVPNGNGLTNPGSPVGNNLSGSPLGPYPSGTLNPSGSPSGIGSVLGSVINTSGNNIRSNLNYPISLYRQVGQSTAGLAPYLGSNGNIIPSLYQGPNGGLTYSGSFNCRNNIGYGTGFEGVVRQVGQNAIQIRSGNGQIFIGAISSCTSAQAKQPNYSLQPGDRVTFSGEGLGNGIYNIYQIRCL